MILHAETYTWTFNEKYLNMSLNIKDNRFTCSWELFQSIEHIELSMMIKIVDYSSFSRKSWDFCQFLNNPRSDMLLYSLYKEIYNAGFSVDKCPIQEVKKKILPQKKSKKFFIYFVSSPFIPLKVKYQIRNALFMGSIVPQRHPDIHCIVFVSLSQTFPQRERLLCMNINGTLKNTPC